MMRGVPLDWEHRHHGPGLLAYEGARLVGQVARYDRTAGPGSVTIVGQAYVGFLRGERVTGDHTSLEAAQAAVERRHGPSAHPRQLERP